MLEDEPYYPKKPVKKYETTNKTKQPAVVKQLLKQTEQQKGGGISEFTKTKLANKSNIKATDRSKLLIFGNFGEVLAQENMK